MFTPSHWLFHVGSVKEAAHYLGVEITLAIEVPVESSVGQTGVRHDGIHRDTLESASIE
jgi:hypothetical protein